MRLAGQAGDRSAGYAMAVLLVSIAVMAVLWTVAIPVWRHSMQREKEEELIFRGRQYARAVGMFQRKFANAYPPSIDILVQQKFLRRKYRDPMAKDKLGEFQALYQGTQTSQPGQVGGAGRPTPTGQPGQSQLQPEVSSAQTAQTFGARGGIIGVVSKSKDKSIRLYNGRNHYNEWQFLYTPVTQGPGAIPGSTRPGTPSRPGMPGSADRPPQPRITPGSLPGGINR